MSDSPETTIVNKPVPSENGSPPVPHWLDIYIGEFGKETDRASVILAAAMLDDLLCEILKVRLIPCSNSSDALFDNSNAPLANFSSRIEMGYRLGLITHRFARDLHLVRKIRNSFAHDVSGCHFSDMQVRNRVAALEQSMEVNIAGLAETLDRRNPREMFSYMCGFMLWQLHELKTSLRSLDASGATDNLLPRKK